MNEILEAYYYKHQDEIEQEWEEHVFLTDWGSGEDRITITDEHFWEFVEDRMSNVYSKIDE